MDKILVTKENVHKSMRVSDSENHIGTITSCDDIHNVLVEFDNGGSGLFCLEEGCDTGLSDEVLYLNETPKQTLAMKMHEATHVIYEITDIIEEAFNEYESDVYENLDIKIYSDDHDNSIEIHFQNSMPYPYEPCHEIRKIIFDMGFKNVSWTFSKDTMDVICDRIIRGPKLMENSVDEVRNYEPRHNRYAPWTKTIYGYVDDRFNEVEWVSKYKRKDI
jgi:hypothetical protein